MTADQQREMAEAERLSAQVVELYNRGRFHEAIQLTARALEMRKRVLGESHPDYAESRNDLAFLYCSLGDYARAEPLYKQAIEIRRTVLGETHPDYAQSLNNLAVLYYRKGDYARAESLYKQAVEIHKTALGGAHPEHASILNNLASLYKSLGDYARAEPLYKQAIEIRRTVLGETHPDYAQSLNNLASLYESMGDYARAEPLYKQALEIDRKALREAHPGYAANLNNLAGLYKSLGDYARAEPLYKQALEIHKTALGDRHPDYATSLNNLAGLYHSMGDFARAEPVYKQALEIRRKALGEAHPGYVQSLNNLAFLYESMGDYARAEPLYKQALEIDRKALREAHPGYAANLNNLAVLYSSMGDYAQAEPLARRAVQIAWRNLELTSVVQSERQQLSMNERFRFYLDSCLAITAEAASLPNLVYDEVLAWKGAVSARQQFITQSRQAAGAKQPEPARLYSELEDASRRFATLSRLLRPPEQITTHRDRLAKLSDRIEELEQQLARISADFRAQLAERQRTGAELTAALPEGTALVDILEYSHYQPPEKHPSKGTWQRRCVAFMLHHDKPIARVDLGEAEPIRLAALAWRKRFLPDSRDDTDTEGAANLPAEPAEALQRLVWDKLAPHLENTETLLVSPDGALARFPWAAMPIGEDKYLIEQMAVAVVPVPRMLPEMIAASDAADEGTPSLLLVGDVDYGATTGTPGEPAESRSAPRQRDGTLLQEWQQLANTPQEVDAVRDAFTRRFPKNGVTFLRRAEPTEQHVREAAPGCRYLHLATHGYFAPPELRSALSSTRLERGRAQDLVTRQDVAGFHPGLLSGIVLAGANRALDPEQDDGILTALEVTRLDLRGVDLVTLSACETGLGDTAGGEGLLGLQRAFQAAGAKSVVASLWQVHDAATRQFMVDFYDTLWQRRLPAAKALRQAQLKMLRGGDVLPGGEARGLKLLDDQRPDKQGRLPPYYWAAFVLSGNWQ